MKKIIFSSVMLLALFFAGCAVPTTIHSNTTNNMSGNGFSDIPNNVSINTDEFIIEKVGEYPCVNPTPSLKARCQSVGGIITTKVTSIGEGIQETLGCYPEGTTKDTGKRCRKMSECEGECIWLAGDVITSKSSATCSEHKKPFFIFPGFSPASYVCN